VNGEMPSYNQLVVSLEDHLARQQRINQVKTHSSAFTSQSSSLIPFFSFIYLSFFFFSFLLLFFLSRPI